MSGHKFRYDKIEKHKLVSARGTIYKNSYQSSDVGANALLAEDRRGRIAEINSQLEQAQAYIASLPKDERKKINSDFQTSRIAGRFDGSFTEWIVNTYRQRTASMRA